MGRVRFAVAAALVGSVIVAGAMPAAADAAVTPTVMSTGLTEGQLVGQKQLLHPVVSDGVITLELLVNSELRHSYQQWSDGVMLAPWPTPTDSDADITIRVYDAAGARGEATTRVRVDTVAPQATFLPGSNSIVHGPTTVTATAVSDDVAEIVMFDADDREIARTTSAPWTMTWNATGQAGRVRFTVTDRAGNVSSYQRGYRVDDHGPRVDLAPADNPSVLPAGRNSLYVMVNDISGLDRLEWWVEGAVRSTDRWLSWDFGPRSRTATAEVRAWDNWGNRSTTTFTFTIDADGPVITSITPGHRALVRGSRITSTVQASDPSGIQYSTLVDSPGTDHTAPYTSTVPAGRDGIRTLTWHVVDAYGTSTTARRVVIVDNTRAKLKITKGPVSGAKVKGTVKLTATAADRNGISRVELLINGKVVAKDTTASYKFTINTKKYSKKFKVMMRAYDRAGNVTKTSTRTWHR